MKVYAVLPAGGTGERFGLSVPKQFQFVLGRPLISYTLTSFEKIEWIAKIVVIVSPEHVSTLEAIAKECRHTSKVVVVQGGPTRHRSIKSGVDYIESAAAAGDRPDVIVVHDAVRPFTTENDIASVVDAARRHGAAGVVRPLVSTVVAVDGDGFLSASLDRSAYRASEMPQAFQYEALCKAYKQCTEFDLDYGTECLHLVSKYAKARVQLLDGGENLWKVTYRKDIYAMEGVLKEDAITSWAFVQSPMPSHWFSNVAAAVKSSLNGTSTPPCKVSIFDTKDVLSAIDHGACRNFVFHYDELDPDLIMSNTAQCYRSFAAHMIQESTRANGSIFHYIVRSGDTSQCELLSSLHGRFISALLGAVSNLRQLGIVAPPMVYGILASQGATATDAASLVCAIARAREPALSGQVFCLPAAGVVGRDGLRPA